MSQSHRPAIVEVPSHSARHLLKELEMQQRLSSQLLGEVADAFAADDYAQSERASAEFETVKARMATMEPSIHLAERQEYFIERLPESCREAGETMVASVVFGQGASYKRVSRINPDSSR